MSFLGEGRAGMRVVMIAAVWILGAAALGGRSRAADYTPVGEPAEVVVNSQASLRDIVGVGFRDEAWHYSAELLPTMIPALTYVSGPGDVGLPPKGRWRKPLVLQHPIAKVRVQLNCYRRLETKQTADSPGTPFIALLEPDYEYGRAEFHGLPAAKASRGGRDVFVFCEGDLLFKVEVIGGEAIDRQATIATTSEAIWRFRKRK